MDKKDLKAKLADVFERYAASVSDMIYRYDCRHNRYDFISKSIELQTGYSIEEVEASPQKMAWQMVHPNDRNRFWQEMTDHIKRGPDGGPFFAEYRIVRKDGTSFWASDYKDFEFDQTGQTITINGIIRDITERKMVETALLKGQQSLETKIDKRTRELKLVNDKLRQEIRKHEETQETLRLFREVLENASMAVAISDMTGRVLYVNTAHEGLFGRKIEKGTSVNYRDYYPEESIQLLNEVVAPALARGESWEGIMDAYDRAGGLFSLWERADVIKDLEGRSQYCFGIMQDVSKHVAAEKALKENEQELARQNLLLEHKNIALSELMGRVKEEKDKLENQVMVNLDQFLFPLLAKLKERVSEKERPLVELVKQNLKQLTAPFGRKMVRQRWRLTRRELEIVNLIRNGMSTKEVASLLHLSVRSVENHRKNIRTKLGLTNQKINLATYLCDL